MEFYSDFTLFKLLLTGDISGETIMQSYLTLDASASNAVDNKDLKTDVA